MHNLGTVPTFKMHHVGKKVLKGEGNQRGWIERVGGGFPNLLALGLGATIEKERTAPRGG